MRATRLIRKRMSAIFSFISRLKKQRGVSKGEEPAHRGKKARKKPLAFFVVLATIPLTVVVAQLTTPYLMSKNFNIPKAALVAASISMMTPISISTNGNTQDTPLKIEFVDKTEDELSEDEIPYEVDTVSTTVIPPALSGEDTAGLNQISPPAVKPANAGAIVKKFYEQGQTAAFINLNSGFLKNCTTLSADEILKTAEKKPKFKITADGSPEVLLMHTHTTESYQSDTDEWFEKGSSSRTTDNSKNMVRVGEEIKRELEAVGIGVIHDKTLHDYPSYNGAYERSAETVKKILKENPSIKVVLDVHRDAIQPDADTMIAPTVEINGKSCAQVMIIAGCENGKLGLPNFKENLKFASLIQRQMSGDYQGLARPILFDYRKYNQNLTTGSLLLEMGGHANTLEEAIYCGELVGKSIATALIGLK